jgi:ABC-type multidrug transport system fused ATPase/permease subunit
MWTYYKDFLLTFFFKFIQCMFDLGTPLIIKFFIDFIENPTENDVSWGMTLGGMYVLITIIQHLIGEQCGYFQERLGMKAKNSAVGLIYSKTLRLSNATNKKYEQGDVINFMGRDARRIKGLFGWELSEVAKIPFTLIYSVIFLYYYFGWTIYGTILVLLATSGLQWIKQPFDRKLGKAGDEARDKKMNTITEMVNNVKTIKLNSYIDHFMDKIFSTRKKELWCYYKNELNGNVGWLIGATTNPLLYFVSFYLFLYHGGKMSVSDAFAAVKVI